MPTELVQGKDSTRHVLYVITKLELGGAQKVCLTLLREVPYDTYGTSLLAGAGGILDAQVSENTQVTLLPQLHREVSIRRIWNELGTFFSLFRQMRAMRKKYSQLIVHTHSTKAGIMGRWAAWCARVPIRIHTIHGFAFHRHQPWWQWWMVYVAELITSFITTHFVCASTADVQTACQLFPGFSQKYTLIRAGVAIDRFAAARPLCTQRAKKPFILGTVSCFKPQKNLIDLLRAFHCVYQQNPEVRCEIIGDGVQRPFLEAWIAEHNLCSVITLHGWQEDIVPFMTRWHAFVLSSLWEATPCVIVEARTLKLPIIAYDTGGVSDIVFLGKNGLLCPQKEWKKLADSIHAVVTDSALYETLASYHDDFSNFSCDAMVQQHRTLYQKLWYQS